MEKGTEKQTAVNDIHGAADFIRANREKDLTVFIVDDNVPYLDLLKKIIERPNLSVFTFTTGEECLEYLQLNPDLVILDYHLDGVNPYAMKGDRVAEIVASRVPSAEIIMISSDNKFNLISELHLAQAQKIIYKDEQAATKIKTMTEKMSDSVLALKTGYKTAFFLVLIAFIIENILLIVLS